MKTTALPVSRQQFPPLSGLIARLPDFIALTKPRVMALAVFTAVILVATGSIWIMANLNETMIPPPELMKLHMQH